MDCVNIVKLFSLCEKPDALMKQLQDWTLIPREGEYCCPTCGGLLSLVARKDRCSSYQWVCKNKVTKRKQKRMVCGVRVEVRNGTFFERSHLTFFQILCFAHMWSRSLPLDAIGEETGISSSKSLVDWSSFCREVLLNAMLQGKHEKLGGPGRIVEIDESKFGRRKYHRGHRVDGQWVFGGFERETGRIFMVTVPDRTADTLLGVIKEWIIEGTTIVSDFWKAYDCLETEGYVHLKVNHSVNFKDPDTGAHTNSIECSWRHAKASLSTSGRRSYHLPGNLARYVFQKRCRALKLDRTVEFFRLAGNLYDSTRGTDEPAVCFDEVVDDEDEQEL